MAETFSNELTNVIDGNEPAEKANGAVVGGNVIRRRATITLNAQASADTIVLCRRKVGEAFAYGHLITSATLGSSTVKIGPRSDDDAFRAAATFTSANAPALFGTAAAVAADQAKPSVAYDGGDLSGDSGNSDSHDVEEDIILTIGTAALPGSGTLVVDLFFSKK